MDSGLCMGLHSVGLHRMGLPELDPLSRPSTGGPLRRWHRWFGYVRRLLLASPWCPLVETRDEWGSLSVMMPRKSAQQCVDQPPMMIVKVVPRSLRPSAIMYIHLPSR